MYALKVSFRTLCWIPCSNFQRVVVRHAICSGSAWYAYVPAIPLL